MGVYIGYVEQRKVEKKPGMSPAVFYDFTPVGEIKDGYIYNLSREEQKRLLPDSENHNINFFYDWKKDNEKMRSAFRDYGLVVFEFTAEDLMDNMQANGLRNQTTAYKVQAVAMLNNGRIRSLTREGIYYAVKKEDILSDFYKDEIVNIRISHPHPGIRAFVELRDQFWSGPYEPYFHKASSSWCIRPALRERNYVVKGYKTGDYEYICLKDPGKDNKNWELFMPRSGVQAAELDVSPVSEEEGQDTEKQQKPVEEYENLQKRMEQMKAFLETGDDIAELQKKKSYMEREVQELEIHREHLKTETRDLETGFVKMINNPYEKMVDLVFDGFMSSKMLNAAAKWEGEQALREHEHMVDQVNKTRACEKSPEELTDYLCRTVKIARPDYSDNTIINIAICLTQSLLTVFYGKPGCGKTSICNIFGQVLGLNKFADLQADNDSSGENPARYIPVSVERGWTSKRDLIGYYNPLSKTFDKSNRRIYDALHQLDTEKRKHMCRFPLLILLDEANLSPMEYYWSDFMNICDDLSDQSTVNLGENYVFGIPETLHFCATINNDHTTETLSPRLIDRAWVITLPRQTGPVFMGKTITEDQVELIAWDDLKNAFIPPQEEWVLSPEIQKTYDQIVSYLEDNDFTVSPRSDLAVRKYWAAASKNFKKSEKGTDPEVAALDYAVAQRIFPRLAGNGEVFQQVLTGLMDICTEKGLVLCADILQDMIRRGDQQMKYYQFFA